MCVDSSGVRCLLLQNVDKESKYLIYLHSPFTTAITNVLLETDILTSFLRRLSALSWDVLNQCKYLNGSKQKNDDITANQ